MASVVNKVYFRSIRRIAQTAKQVLKVYSGDKINNSYWVYVQVIVENNPKVHVKSIANNFILARVIFLHKYV